MITLPRTIALAYLDGEMALGKELAIGRLRKNAFPI
jgi:hypothetical protein